MIVNQGGWFGGNALYLLDGRLTFSYARSHYPEHKYTVAAADPLAPGDHEVVLEFHYDGGAPGSGGEAALIADGAGVARGRVEQTVPVRISAGETLDIGEDSGTPVVRDYDVPFRFSGHFEKVTIDTDPKFD